MGPAAGARTGADDDYAAGCSDVAAAAWPAAAQGRGSRAAWGAEPARSRCSLAVGEADDFEDSDLGRKKGDL